MISWTFWIHYSVALLFLTLVVGLVELAAHWLAYRPEGRDVPAQLTKIDLFRAEHHHASRPMKGRR